MHFDRILIELSTSFRMRRCSNFTLMRMCLSSALWLAFRFVGSFASLAGRVRFHLCCWLFLYIWSFISHSFALSQLISFRRSGEMSSKRPTESRDIKKKHYALNEEQSIRTRRHALRQQKISGGKTQYRFALRHRHTNHIACVIYGGCIGTQYSAD